MNATSRLAPPALLVEGEPAVRRFSGRAIIFSSIAIATFEEPY